MYYGPFILNYQRVHNLNSGRYLFIKFIEPKIKRDKINGGEVGQREIERICSE